VTVVSDDNLLFVGSINPTNIPDIGRTEDNKLCVCEKAWTARHCQLAARAGLHSEYS